MKRIIINSIGTFMLFAIGLQLNAQTIEDAVTLSHSGKYVEAEKVFNSLLEKDGNNTSILIASGYNSAWVKNYKTAELRFKKALQIEPGNKDAAKGLAYTYLYDRNYTKAAASFSKIVSRDPGSEEAQFGLGLAYMNLQKKHKAELQFKKVLEINSLNADATEFINEIESGEGIVELSALAGISSSAGENKYGLRQVQAGYQINTEVQVYARYDNSLAQDNYFFIKNSFNSNTILGGVYAKWHYRIGSKFEYGYRSLPGSINQNIFQTEQVVFLPGNFAVKIGGSIVSSANLPQEWMLMSGISVPVGSKIKIEPNYYFISRLYDEHRVLLNLNYNLSPESDITLGVFNGSEKNTKTNIKSNVFGAYTYANLHIKGPFSITLLTRYENDAFDRNSFIAAGGFKVRLNTK